MLDFDLERMLVEQVIRRSNRKIELMFEYASTKTLRNMVTLGHRALHFSGHGFKDSLAFEDEHGGLHMVVVNQLRHLCAAGGKKVAKLLERHQTLKRACSLCSFQHVIHRVLAKRSFKLVSPM